MEKTIVQTQYLDLELPPEGFLLSSGERLKQIRFAYEAYGTLSPERDNTIFIVHALTGDAHAAFYHSDDEKSIGWWDDLIGPGKAVDTDRYYVVCVNILGGCKGTTGPSSINPDTGEPFGSSFPLVNLDDTVEAEKLFLDQLGVPRLYAVIGGSLGGMRALNWAIRYPDFVERCVCIASAVNLTPQALAFDIIARQEIEQDYHWHDGAYYDRDEHPHSGLARARQIGHVTYLSAASMRLKFGREQHNRPQSGLKSKFSTNFEVESYLDYQGQKFIQRFDANSYLYITRMMDMFDLAKEHGSTLEAFAAVKSRFLIVSITSDWLFPPEQQHEIVSALVAHRKDVSFFQIDSPYGHDAFLIEYEILCRGVDAFLSGGVVDHEPGGCDRLDFDRIVDMVDSSTYMLDVGSGDGELMYTLGQRKNVRGVCLDRDFDMVVACMQRGLPALQLDAESGLAMINDNAFDCILLNQTLQQLQSALRTVTQILRVAPTAIIGFPNFAFYAHRLAVALSGKLPVSDALPYEWYDTPNIHLVTVRDFRDLCQKHGITIEEMHYLSDDAVGRFFIALALPNLGAERVLTRIHRPA